MLQAGHLHHDAASQVYVKSNLKSQNCGISQGCTLSRCLSESIVAMTVLMNDAVPNLSGSPLLHTSVEIWPILSMLGIRFDCYR